MREIKFRAWDRLSKKFNEIKDLITVDGSIQAVRFAHFTDGKDFQGIDYVNLQQYTGLHDKNGKEIYEGDIVSECSWIDWRTNPGREWCKGREIVWDDVNCRFCFREKDGTLDCFNLSDKCGFEVISNIYETPELLK